MILTSALVLMAAAAFQAPAPEPTKTSVLPPDCGLTEQQVVDLAFPEYRARRTDPITQDNRGDLTYYQAKIVDAVTTDFGRGFGRFVIAAVDLRTNQCDFCQKTALLVIDTRTHELAWREDSPGVSEPDPNGLIRVLRLIRLFPDDPVLTLVCRWDRLGCAFGCGASSIYEEWFRPRLTAASSLAFDVVWEAEIGGFGMGNGWDHDTDGEMHTMCPKRAYLLTHHTRAGWNAAGVFDYSLDLITNQEFTQDPGTARRTPKLCVSVQPADPCARVQRRTPPSEFTRGTAPNCHLAA